MKYTLTLKNYTSLLILWSLESVHATAPSRRAEQLVGVGALLLRGAQWMERSSHTEACQQASFFRHGANSWPLDTILNLSAGKRESVSPPRTTGESPPPPMGIIWRKLSVGRYDRRAAKIPALKSGVAVHTCSPSTGAGGGGGGRMRQNGCHISDTSLSYTADTRSSGGRITRSRRKKTKLMFT